MHYYHVLPNFAPKKNKEIKSFFLFSFFYVVFIFWFRWKRNKSNHSHGESETVGFSAMDETLIKRTYFV